LEKLYEQSFFDQPVLNSPYTVPERHWELDDTGWPMQKVLSFRRPASFTRLFFFVVQAMAKVRSSPGQ
jgi:hypothetical protein